MKNLFFNLRLSLFLKILFGRDICKKNSKTCLQSMKNILTRHMVLNYYYWSEGASLWSKASKKDIRCTFKFNNETVLCCVVFCAQQIYNKVKISTFMCAAACKHLLSVAKNNHQMIFIIMRGQTMRARKRLHCNAHNELFLSRVLIIILYPHIASLFTQKKVLTRRRGKRKKNASNNNNHTERNITSCW